MYGFVSLDLEIVPLFLKKESFFSHMKEALTGSYYKGEPIGTEGWAYKSAGFFMQQFVMLAQSKGWGTLYMGGFDSHSIKKTFKIPKTYDVCCTIAVGYPDDTEKYHEHPRFPPSMVIYENEFASLRRQRFLKSNRHTSGRVRFLFVENESLLFAAFFKFFLNSQIQEHGCK